MASAVQFGLSSTIMLVCKLFFKCACIALQKDIISAGTQCSFNVDSMLEIAMFKCSNDKCSNPIFAVPNLISNNINPIIDLL